MFSAPGCKAQSVSDQYFCNSCVHRSMAKGLLSSDVGSSAYAEIMLFYSCWLLNIIMMSCRLLVLLT